MRVKLSSHGEILTSSPPFKPLHLLLPSPSIHRGREMGRKRGGEDGRGFVAMSSFDPSGRSSQSVVVSLEGGILASSDPFPYLFLVAVEAGSLLRGLLLLALRLLLPPFSWRLRAMCHAAMAGLPVQEVEHVARVVLLRFMAADVREDAWRALKGCGGRRVVVTAWPRVVAAAFVKGYLGGEVELAGADVAVEGSRVAGVGVVDGAGKRELVEGLFCGGRRPDVGVGGDASDLHFMQICKEAFMVHPDPDPDPARVPPEQLESATVFYDGRFVNRPDPLHALIVFLWLPIGLLLSLLRISMFLFLPPHIARTCLRLTGVRLTFHGTPPPPPRHAASSRLFVLNHRNNLDPIFICLALGRRLPCVSYKLNRLFQLLSPIPTYELTRERGYDSSVISSLLRRGDLIMCPEGTIARGPVLLRFSALFAELTDNIVPVAIKTGEHLFHGTTFRGSKIVDPCFFFMNPRPAYEVAFLDKVPPERTCGGGGRTRIEVANYVQKVLGERLGFECLSLARKDKYTALGKKGDLKGSPVVVSLESKHH